MNMVIVTASGPGRKPMEVSSVASKGSTPRGAHCLLSRSSPVYAGCWTPPFPDEPTVTSKGVPGCWKEEQGPICFVLGATWFCLDSWRLPRATWPPPALWAPLQPSSPRLSGRLTLSSDPVRDLPLLREDPVLPSPC